MSTFWRAAHDLGLGTQDESDLAGAREGHLVELFKTSGLRDVEEAVLVARVKYSSFDGWWEPIALGVGPAGAVFAGSSADERARLRERCQELLPPAAVRAGQLRLGRARDRLAPRTSRRAARGPAN